MDLNFDKTKTFLYVEDNGDGTCITAMSIPEIGIYQEAVMTMGFAEYLYEMVKEIPPEIMQEMANIMVPIPDSLGE